MKSNFIFSILVILFFSCTKDEGVSLSQNQQNNQGNITVIDTLNGCSSFSNNFSKKSYYKYFSQEQINDCKSRPNPWGVNCTSSLSFPNDSMAGYVEESDAIWANYYYIEGDSIKLYDYRTKVLRNSFYISPDCNERLVERDGDKWFLNQ